MINDYMRVTQVPRHLQKRVRSYFEFLHEADLDHASDPNAVLDTLPESISSRIRVAINIKAIEGVELFETFLSPTCRIMLAARLRTRIGIPGEYLYVQVFLYEWLFLISISSSFLQLHFLRSLHLFCSPGRQNRRNVYYWLWWN